MGVYLGPGEEDRQGRAARGQESGPTPWPSQKAVYAALGMGGDYEAEVASRRKEARAERSDA